MGLVWGGSSSEVKRSVASHEDEEPPHTNPIQSGLQEAFQDLAGLIFAIVLERREWLHGRSVA